MSIKGLENAVDAAIERANRTKLAICIVQIDSDEFILWREITQHAIPLLYQHYKIVKIIRIRYDDFR